MLELEAKFIFEKNLVDWLSALILPHNCVNLYVTILCAEQINSSQQHCFAYTNQNDHNKQKQNKAKKRFWNP